jgi:acyl-CoA hydrolase
MLLPWGKEENKSIMDVISLTTHHLVKSEDLNHHGTLYAGRSAEWFVETGFTAAASLCGPEHILCVKIHGMEFSCPVQLGEIIVFTGKIILTGRTSLVAYVNASVLGQTALEGFLTFVNVDLQGKPQPHGIQIEPISENDKALQEKARTLKK